MKHQQVQINAVYQHYNGGYYRVINIAYHHEMLIPMVIYYRCDENGVFHSIRSVNNGNEEIVPQPFYRILSDFVGYAVGGYPGSPAIPRFKFVKQLNS
jgi:hypothetical protein